MKHRIELEGFPPMEYDEVSGTGTFPDAPWLKIDWHNYLEFYRKLGEYFKSEKWDRETWRPTKQ